MKIKAIVLLALAIVPLTASSQVTLTPIQADNLIRLINDHESIKERHTIVIGRLTEAEEIIWKYGQMVNECDRLRENVEQQLDHCIIELNEVEEKTRKQTKLLKTSIIINAFFGAIISIFIIS